MMRCMPKPFPHLLVLGVMVSVLHSQSQSSKPMLKDGVITYLASNGERAKIQIDKPCADLWVSPDESVIAFITLDKVETGFETAPFPQGTSYEQLIQSSIYIAKKSDNFKPVPITLKPIYVRGDQWKIVRQPSLSPDLKTLYFVVPTYMTSWSVLSTKLPLGSNRTLTDLEEGYCVIWGGKYSGDLLLILRTYGKGKDAGIQYPCFLRNKHGRLTQIADDRECSDSAFDEFASRWSHKNGGVCKPPEFTQIW